MTTVHFDSPLANDSKRHKSELKSLSLRELWKILLLYIVLIFVAAVMLFPAYWMWVTAVTKEGREFSFPPALFPDPIVWENFPSALTAWPFDLFFKI